MARFWRRTEDQSVETLLRASRPEPRDEFASSLLGRIAATPRHARQVASPRRIGLALALTVASLVAASLLGGIGAASAGVGGIFHVAKDAVSPSHTNGIHTTTVRHDSSKGDDEQGDDDQGKEGDHHQYAIGLCHWANHKYVLIFVSPQGAANHLKHHPKDHLAVNGTC